jgi:hypothetical protein
MCPACVPAAGVVVATAVSGGSVMALVARILRKIKRERNAKEKS